jgi:hypothetical protein
MTAGFFALGCSPLLAVFVSSVFPMLGLVLGSVGVDRDQRKVLAKLGNVANFLTAFALIRAAFLIATHRA